MVTREKQQKTGLLSRFSAVFDGILCDYKTRFRLKHPETYHVRRALKFADANVGRSGAVLTVPFYMAIFLEFGNADDIELTPIDADDVNRMAGELDR